MSRSSQGTVLLLVAWGTLGLVVTGRYLAFLKPGMLVPLTATGATLALLGGLTIWPALIRYVDGEDDEGDHNGAGHHARDHGDGTHGCGTHDCGTHGAFVGWLLLLPLVALVLVAPPPLGADAARRDIGRSAPPPERVDFGPLPPPVGGAVELPVSSFIGRARYDRPALAGVSVRLTGFVLRDPSIDDGYLLTRFTLTCCASDAFASQVRIEGLRGPAPPDDSWVEVVGEVVVGRQPALRVQSQRPIAAPDNPYE